MAHTPCFAQALVVGHITKAGRQPPSWAEKLRLLQAFCRHAHLDGIAALLHVQNMRQHQGPMLRHRGQACVAQLIACFRKHHVQAHHLGTQGANELFHQIGHLRTLKWPAAQFLNRKVAKIDQDHLRVRGFGR